MTREELIEEINRRILVTEKYPDLEPAQIDATICKIALTAMTSKPVPVVPDEIKKRLPEIMRTGKANRWEIHDLAKICAMLAAAPHLPATVPGKWILMNEPMPESEDRYLVPENASRKDAYLAGEWNNECNPQETDHVRK